MIPKTLNSQVRRLHLWAKRAVEDWLGGAYHSVFKGVGVAFEEVREYQPGDDVRTIDWNVTARTGTPFIKRFVEERELTVMLAVDTGASMAFGSGARSKRQVAAETAALLGVAALHNSDRVGLLLFGAGELKLIPPRKGARHALRLVRDLLHAAENDEFPGQHSADETPQPIATNLNVALHTLQRILHRRALVFLASDFLCQGYVNALRVTAVRHDLIAMFTQDAWERDLPDLGNLSIRDPATGDALMLDTANQLVRRDYRARMDARADDLRRTLHRAAADCIELSTAGGHLDAVRSFFQIRERRLRR